METTTTRNRVPAWKKQRFHYNGYGHPKRCYTRAEAIQAVKEINAGKEFHVDLVEAYECKNCKQWHVGRSSRAHKKTTLWYELGHRAYHNLAAENIGSRKKRIVRIRNRFRFMGVLYGVQRVPKTGIDDGRLSARTRSGIPASGSN